MKRIQMTWREIIPQSRAMSSADADDINHPPHS